jgi:hypothetical protein
LTLIQKTPAPYAAMEAGPLARLLLRVAWSSPRHSVYWLAIGRSIILRAGHRHRAVTLLIVQHEQLRRSFGLTHTLAIDDMVALRGGSKKTRPHSLHRDSRNVRPAYISTGVAGARERMRSMPAGACTHCVGIDVRKTSHMPRNAGWLG